jgi:hypothetical protein
MLIIYADGTSVAVCSLHCAAAELKKGGRQVKSLKVADYPSKELIDAKTATWVVGGGKNGGMNSPAKWAFAREEEARNFVAEYGGTVTPFDQVMKAADEELADSSHAGHDHCGPGGQMLFNPAFGDDIYHTHPAGMWMVNYKFMHMSMRGLRSGTTNVPASRAIPTPYMMAPTDMTMDMHMFMVMYGVTDRITVMGMANYLDNSMNMLMDMGMGAEPQPAMHTSGVGDTELRGLFKINKYLVGSLGISIPTGDINQETVMMGMKFRAPYDMQLGSGTVDLKPALTYSDLSGDAKWNWGGQAMYTYHTGDNDNHYSLGDIIKVNTWLQRALGPATSWLRLSFTNTQRIHGEDPEIQKSLMDAPSPDADPNNYGGSRLDGYIGTSLKIGAFSIGVEAGIPLYQYLYGLQLKNEWYITAGIQAMF